MRWHHALGMRLRSLFGKGRLDSELDEEIRFHIERQTEENVAAGMAPQAARRAALDELGGVEPIKEECRDARGVTLVHDLVKDLRFGARMLRKQAVFTAMTVLILGLGIGANTAIFSFVDGIMLRGLPVRAPDELVLFEWRARNEPKTDLMMSHGDCSSVETGAQARTPTGDPLAGCSFSFPFFEALRGRSDLFAGITAFTEAPSILVTGDGAPTLATGQLVSGEYFATLGVRAALGRTLEPDDDAHATPVVVLGYDYWQSAYGGRPDVIGKRVTLNGAAFVIVGVADKAFTYLTPGHVYDFWLPLSLRRQIVTRWGAKIDGRSAWWLTIVARRLPDVTNAQAAAATKLIFRPEVTEGAAPVFTAADDPELLVVPATSGLTGARGEYRNELIVLMIAVGIVLAIACANVAGLLLARAGTRRREIAVRLAMGAGRRRIVRQLLTESLLLAVLGGAVGVVVATWGVEALSAFISANQERALGFDIAVDGRVLAFTLAVSLVVGLVFGLAPALRATRVELTTALRDVATGVRARLGSALVVVQVALSILVLAGAGLLVRTLDRLHATDPGFRVDNSLLFSIDPTLAGARPSELAPLYQRIRAELASLPGVVGASYSDMRLLSGGEWTATMRSTGSTSRAPMLVDVMGVGPGFLDAFTIPLLAGRTLTAEDIAEAAAASAASADSEGHLPTARVGALLVNEAFVRRYVPDGNALGELMRYDGERPSPIWQIVGVVRDTKYSDLRREVRPMVYVAGGEGGVSFTVVSASEPALLVPAIRAVIARLAPKVPVVQVRTQRDEIGRLLFRERLMARLSTLFAVVALALACMGLYALLSYEVLRRSREVGIRMALGAQRGDVRRMVVKEGLALTGLGVVLGLGATVAATRSLESMLFGVTPTDPLVLGGVSVLLLVVAAVACYVPARRATRVDPMVALRSE